jgi:hypothetical protein
METLAYFLLAFGMFGGIFLLGWQFGCWMVQRDEVKQNRDLYTNDFHTDYYSTKCCKHDQHHHKPKKKKVSKK